MRETLLSEKYAYENRDVKVDYIYGDTGVGKSRYIFEQHAAIDICRVTNYGTKINPVKFDGYHGQDILVFEEFHHQIPLPDMLNLLDILSFTAALQDTVTEQPVIIKFILSLIYL